MNTTPTRPTAKQVEDAAAQIQRHALQAVDHAQAGDWRRAHASAEQAQGCARRLKELLGAASAAPSPSARPTPGVRSPHAQ
jgi:hypothetical protein